MRRRLDVELVRRGLVPSRTRAVAAIEGGRVIVGGAPADSPARLVAAAEPIRIAGPAPRFVSRGGEKLDAAIERFGVRVAGRRALDAGASTGGFTDCLLQRAATTVIALDVGRGQLDWRLRQDPRVELHERTNLRHVDAEAIGGPCALTVADLSFISLVTVAPALRALTEPDGDLVLLVKPQFEAGRGRVGRGGVVRDASVHRAVLGEVVEGLGDAGVIVTDVMASPLRGADGNVEFLVHAGSRGPDVESASLDAAVGTAHGLGRSEQTDEPTGTP